MCTCSKYVKSRRCKTEFVLHRISCDSPSWRSLPRKRMFAPSVMRSRRRPTADCSADASLTYGPDKRGTRRPDWQTRRWAAGLAPLPLIACWMGVGEPRRAASGEGRRKGSRDYSEGIFAMRPGRETGSRVAAKKGAEGLCFPYHLIIFVLCCLSTSLFL